MEISILGPLRATAGGRLVSLPAKQQALLAILAFQPNRTVSTDRLIAALWGDDAPPTAIKTLQTHVFQLRRLLAGGAVGSEPGPTVVTDGRGYRLSIDPASIDAQRFEQLLQEGRAAATAEPRRAGELLAGALGLWRGPRLAEVADEPFATAEIERLGELRSAAFDEIVRIRLTLADYESVIPEVRRELSESPFREQLWGSLMVALVRSGRKAEALLAYREAEAALRRELDVEPSHELQELAARIRDGDATLAAPDDLTVGSPTVVRRAAEPGAPGSSEQLAESTVTGASVDRRDRPGEFGGSSRGVTRPGRRHGRSQGRIRLTRALVVPLVLLAALAVASRLPGTLAPSPGRSPIASIQPAVGLADSVGRLSEDGRLISSVRLAAQPDEIAIGAGSAWVTNTADDSVDRLDGQGSRVVQSIRVGESPAGIAFGFGAVWVANSGGRTVSRINPTTNEVVANVEVGTAPAGVAVDDRWVWVTNRLDHTVTRIDPTGGRSETFPDGATPLAVATAAGSVWVTDVDSSLVVQMDARTGAIAHEVSVGNGPSAITATSQGDAVWVVNSADGTISRIDTLTSIVTATISVGAHPTGIAIGAGSIWVTVSATAEIVRIDLSSGRIVGRSPVGASPQSVVVDAAGPLFTARGTEGTHRGGTLAVVSPPISFSDTADPSYVDAVYGGLAALTNDGLVTYKKVEGPDGQTVVPDLATSMPVAADGGRTWTFQLRQGITYSNGAALKPADVVGSFERAMRPGGALDGNVELVGSHACETTPTCDLSAGIVVDDQARTVTFHLTAPDPGFLPAITGVAILPAGTPLARSVAPLPATGPYMLDRFVPGVEMRIVRNPQFHEWSADAQPNGFPDAIDWTVSTIPDPSTLVESGQADVAVGTTLSASRLSQLRTRVPAQLHVAPSQKEWFEMMNTHLAPFDRLQVRQAINYAADRLAIVDAWGGPLAARVTCQVIPPEYSGFEPYCPYSVDPPANGTWLGPDLAKAEALIAEAGVKGEEVTVWGVDDHGQHAAVAQYFTNLLDALGFRATKHLLEFGQYFDVLAASPEKVQMAGFWGQTPTRLGMDAVIGVFTCPDFPSTTPYIGQPSEFCDPGIDADVQRAAALEATDPVGANHLLAHIDRAIVDEAPAVMAFNPTDVTLVSQRVANYEHHSVYEILLDQLWVR